MRVGTQVLCSGLLWSPHLTDEEAEAQRGEGTDQDGIARPAGCQALRPEEAPRDRMCSRQAFG